MDLPDVENEDIPNGIDLFEAQDQPLLVVNSPRAAAAK